MILVTGGTGLIGAHLLFELAHKGQQVTALRRAGSSDHVVRKVFRYYADNGESLLKNITWREGNITDKVSLQAAFDGITAVYHCAAVVSFDPRDEAHLIETNVQSTRNIVSLCLENGVQKLCHLSSVAALGRDRNDHQVHFTEAAPLESDAQASAYARSKALSEQEVWAAMDQGLNAIIVNPTIVIGPGDWNKSSAKLISTIWKGLKFYTEGSNSFVDARDVAAVMARLMERGTFGERFIVTAENRPFRDVFNLIADQLGVAQPSIKTKPWMGELAWRANAFYSKLTGKPPVITRDAVAAGHKHYTFSNEKIRKHLEYEFIPLQKSVEDACRIFLKEH
ncbi:MAG: NAD-dependent epimerase/dehydratase family protein [Saprospiraceae bacterium]|nr:NAD-dependent epimerase/dehydratase family protein [Saprospiraceae bacterium]